MHIIQLLNIKFKKEVLYELIKLYDKNDKLKIIDKKTYIQICKIKIKNILKTINFLEQTEKICKYPSDKRCCARIWNKHYGSRCRYKRKNDKEYCQHHINVFKKNGSLRFNRYDETKPLINLNNNKIPWFSDSYIEILNNIIQKQNNRLNLKIKMNLIKDR